MRLKVLILVLTILFPLNVPVFSQPVENPNAEIKQNLAAELKPPIISVQEEENNPLGLVYSAKKIEEAKLLIEENNFPEAENILKETSDWLTSATELHYTLHKTLSTQKNRFTEAKFEKAHALDFGRLRDESYILLAKVYFSENKLKESVSLLTEVVKSQIGQPLGDEAFRILQRIKFSDKTPK